MHVGAAIGATGDCLERASEVVRAGADVVVIDIAHGHSRVMERALEAVRTRVDAVDVVAGNVATAEGATFLLDFRGMASIGAIRDRLDLEDADPRELEAIGAEGLEVSVPARGSVRTIIHDMLKHLCSAVSYGGAQSLQELRRKFWAHPETYL